jgi:plastocyanin domain-containing protein
MDRIPRRPHALAVLALAALIGLVAGCGAAKLAPGEVAIEVTDEGFVPATVTVPKGQPATLVFTRKIEETCAKEVVFTASGEKHELPLKQEVRVKLPAERPDTMEYACGMNMLTGKVVSE